MGSGCDAKVVSPTKLLNGMASSRVGDHVPIDDKDTYPW
jgi:hypothetical protein